jgi:hypothetical protein
MFPSDSFRSIARKKGKEIRKEKERAERKESINDSEKRL